MLRCNNWQDFKREQRSLSQKQKGDSFEAVTKLFLELNPQYTTKLSRVWLLKHVPPDVRKLLNLPNPDEGIDLIAETKEKDYWAIQCKYLDDENHRLTRNLINTFTDLSFTVCRNISFGLVCTTADHFSHKLTMYGDRLGFCFGDTWRQLDSDFFSQVHDFIKGKSHPILPLTPRDHQKEALRDASTFFVDAQNSRGKLIMPCGTGKSLTSYWMAEALKANSVIVAVPSLALIRQSLDVWTRECVANKRDINWICVCSDETVGDIERDDAVFLTQDLGIRIHTNPDDIADWLRESGIQNVVVFSTYQSGKAIGEAAKKAGFIFDLGIMDEAHKTVGRIDSLFSTLLNDENIPIKKRIFMTATERRYLGQSEQIASMDDPKLYGETFSLLSFKDALESQPPILCDYRIVTMMVDKSEIHDLIKRNVFVKPDKGKWDEEVEAEMLAAAIALRKAMIKYPIKHAVSFHKSISRAKDFKKIQDNLTDILPEYGALSTFHVSGKTPTGVRAKEIEAFTAAERSLITNARCLAEGVDVPRIDCVLFADPKKSTVDIVQAVGRALRPSPITNKLMGYIILPIILNGESPELEPHHNAAFSSILTVLRALAANDDRIIEYFRAISQGRRSTDGIIDFGIDVQNGVSLNAEKFISSIELNLWSRLAKLAWRPFEKARIFVHGLKFVGNHEWRKFSKGLLPEKGTLPSDIPATPDRTYKSKGWKTWGDWLGTGTIANFLREYRPFEEARAFVQTLGLLNNDEWRQFCRGGFPEKGALPSDIPVNPDQTYKNQDWKGYGDWLGTGTIASGLINYRPFAKAWQFARALDLKSGSEWRMFCKGLLPNKGMLPDDIPAKPDGTYMNKGWKGWGDWLGTGSIAFWLREYRPFTEAREFALSLGLKNVDEWRRFCKGDFLEKGLLPTDIPSNPNNTYKNQGWKGWGDWLGTGTIAPRLRKYRPFTEAKEFARSLDLKNVDEWVRFCKGRFPEKGTLPDDIPAHPRRTYENQGWKGYGDWLGTGTIANFLREYRTFEEARGFARGLTLKSGNEWRRFCKGLFPEKGALPSDIPVKPERTYKNFGWKGMGDWLGTGTVAPRLRKYRPFEKARQLAQGLELKNRDEWQEFCKGHFPEKGMLPDDIPANPNTTYKNLGWKGMGDWLGTGTIAPRLRKYRSFEEAIEFVHTLGLRNNNDWRQFCRGLAPEKGMLPSDIPANPDRTYKYLGWTSWGDWLRP
ncbi:MAG: restriction endonuclease [Syntrophorhabdaceae bacterium]